MTVHPFNIPAGRYSQTYREQSYVHLEQVVTPELITLAQTQIEKFQAEQQNFLSEWDIKNKKQQYLFELPDDETFLTQLFEGVAVVTGLAADKLTLAERHLHIYAQNAAPNPPPHKDRLSSEVTMVLPISASDDSRVILYPIHQRKENPFVASAQWRASLNEEELPENILKDIEPVLVDVRPGDMICFPGSAIYHGRQNSAGTIILTMKFNTLNLDPLGEDPRTVRQREQSLAILAQKSHADLLESTLTISPKLYRISHHYSRLGWEKVTQAYLWGEKEFTLSPLEKDILMTLEGTLTGSALQARLNIANPDVPEYLTALHRLGQLGGIDVLS